MQKMQALLASPYDTAILEENNCYTVIDGSGGKGAWTVAFGVTGMPPRETYTDLSSDAAINHPLTKTVDGKESDNWKPVEEAES